MPRKTSPSLALAFAAILSAAISSSAAAQEVWSGNMVRNPGFEEDFINSRGEGHVISFKGDWFYNQQDLWPDYWPLAAATMTGTRSDQTAHGGKYSLKLDAGATVQQMYQGAVFQEGGSAWGSAPTAPIPITKPDKLRTPWRATVWCRGGGKITLGGIEAAAPAGAEWQQVSVTCPADKVPADASMTVILTGPGEFDDLVVEEQLPVTPNLLPNASFEEANADGHPAGWSPMKKFDWIGPTYYVWTDWNHYHSENRGPVRVDPIVSHSGKQSMRFDMYPGDEKYIESDLIELKQDAAHVIEVGAWVRGDRIKMIDIRCVDEDGANMPSYYPIQPEYGAGGTATFGNGTFGWRYIRKYFGPTFAGTPVKGIRVRLASRGFNAHTLDDAGTRSYAMTSSTVWWDDVRVVERTSDAAALTARGVKIPAAAAVPTSADFTNASVDLGERFFGENALTVELTNPGAAASFTAKVTTTIPGAEKPVTTESAAVPVAQGATGAIKVPYTLDRLAGELKKQGTFKVELMRDGKPVGDATYAFNTWPVIVDIDISRHYNAPNENPNTTSLNLGVAEATLAKVAKLEIDLKRVSDGKSLGMQTITDLKAAYAKTIAELPKKMEESYEFKLPTPAWWTDRKNLILVKLDMSQMKVWPHDNPTRDTVLEVRGVDAAGKVLFSEKSDGLCRVENPPKPPAITSVTVRADGAVLINEKPKFLMGATHQNIRTTHSPDIIAQLGLMGHRLMGGELAAVTKLWSEFSLYSLQIKPVDKAGTTEAYATFTEEQKKAFSDWVATGAMQSVVSVNTGGWESAIPDTADARASHQVLNDWIRQLTKRPIAWSPSGAYNAWEISHFPYYDIVHAETEMWGPMDFNVIFTPYMKKLRKEPTTWVYLPQLYDNTPYERYRFETYENIIRGSAGTSMIQGIGDPSFNRGLAGELRYLEGPLYSTEKAPDVKLEPNVSNMVRKQGNKTYILATNAGPITMGRWKWDAEQKHSGKASHEGDSINRMWFRPDGVRIHGFRGLPHPEMVEKGDKIVQYVWLDPKETPEWAMVAVRGDGRYSHAGVYGPFDYEKFRLAYGNILMYSELEHSVWHYINWVFDPPTYARAVRLKGQKWADEMKTSGDASRAKVDALAYKAADFQNQGALPKAGEWHRIELDADKLGLTGKLIDGFAYLTKNGRALWDYSALERDGKVVRVFCEDTEGIDRELLKSVRVSVPGLKSGTKVKALFEDREIVAEDGGFTDSFEGVETYGEEAGAVAGDMFGYVKDDNRELPRMMPSGYGYSYGPTAVHIYEIEQ